MSSRGANDVDSSKDSGHAALETLVSRLHEEVMQKLEEQHSLLRRAHPLVPSMPILFDPQGVVSPFDVIRKARWFITIQCAGCYRESQQQL